MKKTAALFLALTLLFSSAVFAENPEYKNEFTVSYMDMIIEHIAETYKFGVTEGQLYETIVKKMLDENPKLLEEILETAFDSLDKHSDYLTRAEMQDLMGSINASVCGIGVNVQERNGEIVVLSCLLVQLFAPVVNVVPESANLATNVGAVGATLSTQ